MNLTSIVLLYFEIEDSEEVKQIFLFFHFRSQAGIVFFLKCVFWPCYLLIVSFMLQIKNFSEKNWKITLGVIGGVRFVVLLFNHLLILHGIVHLPQIV